jgi:hypothetical protein
VKPDVNSRRRLWGDSGGYCGNPACRGYLFPDGLDVDFGELAHVIPALPDGPRGKPEDDLSLQERVHHNNLILLCANCHTTIDKTPDRFPVDLVQRWKRIRIDEIRIAIAAPTFGTRAEARAHIDGALQANRAIFTRYGPGRDPYAQGNPVLWHQHARSTIVPNNRKVLDTLDANRLLLTSDEQEVLAVYKLHVEQFEARHVLDEFTTGTERFPSSIGQVFLEKKNQESTS